MPIQIIDRGTAGDTGDKFKIGVALDTCQANDDYLDAKLTSNATIVDTFASLATTPGTAGKIVTIRCHTSGTTGGGQFIGVAGSVTNDGGTQINSATAGIYWKRINYTFPFVEFFGALGDGVTDETSIFTTARNAIGRVFLTANKTYVISSKIAATADNQGFVCPNGEATILMLSGSGKFDRSSYSGSQFDNNACGFYCEGYDSYQFLNIKIQFQFNASVRTVKAFAIRDSNSSKVKATAIGFQEVQSGIFTVDSCGNNCDFDFEVYDCGTSNNTLPSMQITCVDIDNNKIGGVSTTHSTIRGRGKNIALIGSALSTYGPQTDGINISTGDKFGLKIYADFENVGETFDCFGSFVKATVQGKTIGAYGVKLIHGAQHCIVDAIIDTTAGAAVVLGGSNTASQSVAHNIVRITASNVGVIASSYPKAGVHFDGGSATYTPQHNYIMAVLDNTGSMDNAVFIDSGSSNLVEYKTDTTQTINEAVITSAAGLGNKIIKMDAPKGGYVSGRFYGGGSLNIAAGTTLALSANVMYGTIWTVDETHIFPAIGFNVTVVGAGSARLGIYKWTNGKIGDLILDVGTTSVNGLGVNNLSIAGGAGISLPAGDVALVILTDVACTISGTSASIVTVNKIGIAVPSTADTQLSRAFAYAALPSSFGAMTYAVGNAPTLWLVG